MTANRWDTKVSQAGATARAADAEQVTVIAGASDYSGAELAARVAEGGIPPGVDIAIVDLYGYLDTTSARLTPVARSAAVKDLYRHLVTWGKTRPDLVDHLVSVLQEQGLATTEATGIETESNAETDIRERVARLRELAREDDERAVEVSREDLTNIVSWIDRRLDEDGAS